MQRVDQLWYHAVWATKHRGPLLTPDHFKTIATLCAERAEEWQFHLEIVNGTTDHVHILIQIHPERTVSQVIGWIKGSTSHFFGEGFEWQSGYLIQTVSPSELVSLCQYLQSQSALHDQGQTKAEWELPE